jgi:cerevisin
MIGLISVFALSSLLPFVSPLYIPGYHESNYEAPLHVAENAKTIDDHYIVVFHPHVDDFSVSQHHCFLQTALVAEPPRTFGNSVQQPFAWHNPLHELFGSVRHLYNNTLKGYSGRFSKGAIDMLRKDPAVAFVEQDQEMHVTAQEKDAPWGLARVSHKETLEFDTFNKYDYDDRGGLGVTGILPFRLY